MATVTVTRRTIFGFGVNTTPTEDNPGYHFELPKKPDWQGTYKTITDTLETDPYYNSIKNGTYRSEAWFVRSGGRWKRIVGELYIDSLYSKHRDGWYYNDTAEVEVEDQTD